MEVAPKSRRTLQDIERYYPPDEIHLLITNGRQPEHRPTAYTEARNRALVALTYLTGGRISEVLTLTREQFQESKAFLMIRNMAVHKRRIHPSTGQVLSKGIQPRSDPMLPLKKGPLVPLTQIVQSYLPYVPVGHLFPFQRRHALRLIVYQTGKWPHWFRAQMQSFVGRRIQDRKVAGRYFGVNPASMDPYIIPEESVYARALTR